MKLSRKEITILQKIVDSDAFELLQSIGSELLVKWNEEPLVGETAFQTIRAAVGRQERKKAIQLFLETVQSLSHEQ